MIFILDVDGERFDIRQGGDGGTNYDWLSGPNKGYGFASSPGIARATRASLACPDDAG